MSNRQQNTHAYQLALAMQVEQREHLLDLITNTIEPATWSVYGGAGGVSMFDDVLVVSNTPTIHQRVAELLTMLHTVQEMRREAEPKATN